MSTPLLPWDNARGYRDNYLRRGRQQSILLALAATILIHSAVLKLGISAFSWVSVPTPVMTLPLLVSLAPLSGDFGPAVPRGNNAPDAKVEPGSDAVLPPAAKSHAISAPSIPSTELGQADFAEPGDQFRLDASEFFKGISGGRIGVGDVNSLSGLALSAALDRRMQRIMEQQGNYVARTDNSATEDIVSTRAKCLVVPFAFMGPVRESDSTITMPDPYCKPDPEPFALDGPRR